MPSSSLVFDDQFSCLLYSLTQCQAEVLRKFWNHGPSIVRYHHFSARKLKQTILVIVFIFFPANCHFVCSINYWGPSNVPSTVLSRLPQSFGWGNILIGVGDTALTSSLFGQFNYTHRKKKHRLSTDFPSIPYQFMSLSQPQFVFTVCDYTVIPTFTGCIIMFVMFACASPYLSHNMCSHPQTTKFV